MAPARRRPWPVSRGRRAVVSAWWPGRVGGRRAVACGLWRLGGLAAWRLGARLFPDCRPQAILVGGLVRRSTCPATSAGVLLADVARESGDPPHRGRAGHFWNAKRERRAGGTCRRTLPRPAGPAAAVPAQRAPQRCPRGIAARSTRPRGRLRAGAPGVDARPLRCLRPRNRQTGGSRPARSRVQPQPAILKVRRPEVPGAPTAREPGTQNQVRDVHCAADVQSR